MPTNYPNGNDITLGSKPGYDEFKVTSNPDITSLSQGGQNSDGRNHAKAHEDMGDAIEALQTYAALKSHDHSGDPGDRSKGSKLTQANTHQSPDTDTSATALHHTLASHLPIVASTTGRYQAAAGNHTHPYTDLVNTPLRFCTSGPGLPTGVPVGTMVYETDTNRMRVWGAFNKSNTANTGLNATDSFDRNNPGGMNPTSGTALWQQVYTPGSYGVMGTNGTNLAWTDSGGDPARCIATRINNAALTDTDDQIITWKTSGNALELLELYATIFGATPSSNDMYFRMSADGTNTTAPSCYLRLSFAYDQWSRGVITLYGTQTGPAGEQVIGTLSAPIGQPDTYWIAELIGNTLTVYYGTDLEGSTNQVGKIVDTYGVARIGQLYRGWGVGMVAGNRQGLDAIAFGQVTPSQISMVNIRDAVYYTGQARWQLLPVANIPIVRLRQNTTQAINADGSYIQWHEELEDSFGFFSASASNTKITVSEPGLYHLTVGIQWNVSAVPELGTVIAVVDGTETELMNTSYQKLGTLSLPVQLSGSTPKQTFSQTLSLSGKVRLADRSTLSIKVKHSAPTGLQIISLFDQGSKITSRLDLTYVSP